MLPRLVLLVFLAAVLPTATASHSTRPFLVEAHDGRILTRDGDGDAYRLKLALNGIKPEHYDISLTPVFPTEGSDTDITDFEGEVTITVQISKEISEITLHAADNLDVHNITVTKENDPTETNYFSMDEDSVSWTVNLTYQFLKIELASPLKPDTYKIFFKYSGKFPKEEDENNLYGFYKSTYSTKETETSRLLLVTQFQPTHARKAFPCFDEPLYKATYTVALTVPSAYGVIGNTEVEEKKEGEKASTYKFEMKKPMSTYLLAFIVYERASFTPTEASETIPYVKTWAKKAEVDDGNANLSTETAPEVIAEMSKYTGIPFPFKKIDQAAIPDFSFGAMENWGLVTYRETALLFNSREHTETARKRVVQTIAHELSHQWFGNLVTTAWWGSMWLNEGFATYFEYYVTDKLYNEWFMTERMLVDEQFSAFATDALISAPPLTSTSVNSPSEVQAHMGTITYSKGGSVLRMFINLLGEENFRSGVNEYLNENSEESVEPSDLFTALKNNKPDHLTSEDLDKFFISWTEAPGFPVLSLGVNEKGKLTISQKRFMLDNSKQSEKYHIPLQLQKDGEDIEGIFWLRNDKEIDEFNIDVPENVWLLVKNTGYFRVNYTEETWGHLVQHFQSLDAAQKATLLNDVLNLARADQLSYDTAFQLVRTLQDETGYIPWAAAFYDLAYLYRMLAQVDDERIFDDFVRGIVNSTYEDLGFKEEDEGDQKNWRAVHRNNILTWACRSGHTECIDTAVEKLTAHVDNNVDIDPNLRSVVYCYGVKHGDERLWLHLWDKLKTTQDAAERSLLLSALGCTDSISTLQMYLEQSTAGVFIRSQDASSVFSAVYSNPNGVDTALDFLVYNSLDVFRSYGSMNALPNTIRGIANYIFTEDQINKLKLLENFKSGNSMIDETVQNAAKAAIESAKANMEWVEKKKDVVLDAIEKSGAETPGGGGDGGDGGNGSAWTLQPAAAMVTLALVTVVMFH